MNVEVKATETNMEATAFLGVISTGKGIFHYRTWKKSVNTEKYIEFLRELRKKHGKGKINIVMDSLRVHDANLSWNEYLDLNIEPIFTPIYSPDYNSIEMVFSKLKRIVKRLRLRDMLKQRKRTFPELIAEAVREVSKEDVNHCIEHVMKLYGIN